VTARSPSTFDAQDVVIAFSVAILAQFGFLGLFSLPSPKLVEADISNDNARPIAVAITPVLKLGSKTPSAWQRKRPPPPPAAAAAKTQAAVPSPLADKTPEAIPSARVPDASVAPVVVDAGREPPMQQVDAAPAAAVASTEGSEQGAANGTETDPFKAKAADLYRAELLAWFQSRFHIRGKIPFDELRKLHAHVVVSITPDRTVGSFTVDHPSGDATFDGEVTATLSQIQASGVELPAPPPNYPDMLRSTLPVGFQCTERAHCE
jgi:hypothetical protein